jgi:twitching motility protein PilT
MIEVLNATGPARIVHIEDPVEYRIPGKKAIVTQQAPRGPSGILDLVNSLEALDPDVVAIGDLSGMPSNGLDVLLRLARGGRQVLAVCEGMGSVSAIQGLVARAPSEQQRRLVGQLAGTMEAVVALRMAFTRDGRRRAVVELLRGGPFIARALAEARYDDLERQLTGRQGGMQSFDQHLVELYQAGEISGTEALRLATVSEAVASVLRGSKREGSA